MSKSAIVGGLGSCRKGMKKEEDCEKLSESEESVEKLISLRRASPPADPSRAPRSRESRSVLRTEDLQESLDLGAVFSESSSSRLDGWKVLAWCGGKDWDGRKMGMGELMLNLFWGGSEEQMLSEELRQGRRLALLSLPSIFSLGVLVHDTFPGILCGPTTWGGVCSAVGGGGVGGPSGAGPV